MKPLALLLIVFLGQFALPTGGAQAATDFELPDQRGDPKPSTIAGPAPAGLGQPTPATDEVDITSLRVIDAADSLVIEVRVADVQGPAPKTPLTGSDSMDIKFAIAGSTVTYSLYGYTRVVVNVETSFIFTADFCVGQTSRSTCARDRIPIVAHDAQNLYRLTVPKSYLLGQNMDGSKFSDRTEVVIPRLDSGTEFASWSVRFQRYIGFVGVALVDTVEGSAGPNGPFRLNAPVPNQDLIVRRADAARRDFYYSQYEIPPYVTAVERAPVAVIIGQTTTIALVLQNKGDIKRLVNLEASLETSDASSKWKLQVPAAIEVPAGQVRNATVTVTLDPGVEHREETSVSIVARALGSQDLGFLRLNLVAGLPVDPAHTHLHMHAGANQVPGGRPCAPFENCARTFFWLNGRAEDPLANRDAGATPGTAALWVPSHGVLADFNLLSDTPIADRLVFASGSSVTGKVSLSARSETPTRISFALSTTDSVLCTYGCGDERVIALGSKDVILSGSATPIEFSIPVDANTPTIEPGTRYLRLRLSVMSTDPRAATSGTLLNGITLYPKEGGLDLPLVAADDATGPPSHLRFYVEGDREEFLNPGKTRLFKVRLANEGPATDRVIVNTSLTPDAWTLQVQPGNRFELKAGESVILGVLLKAPESAAEGQMATVRLTAASEVFQSPQGRLTLRGVATRGVDVPDDAQAYQPDEDTQKRALVEKPKDSPGPGAAALFAAAVAIALLRRRA